MMETEYTKTKGFLRFDGESIKYTCNFDRYFNRDPEIVRWDNCSAGKTSMLRNSFTKTHI